MWSNNSLNSVTTTHSTYSRLLDCVKRAAFEELVVWMQITLISVYLDYLRIWKEYKKWIKMAMRGLHVSDFWNNLWSIAILIWRLLIVKIKSYRLSYKITQRLMCDYWFILEIHTLKKYIFNWNSTVNQNLIDSVKHVNGLVSG